MSDNIKPLFPGQHIPGEVNQYVVELLEDMLARAKSGQIKDVAVAAWSIDNASVTGFTPGSPVSLLGVVTRLAGRIERSIQEET